MAAYHGSPLKFVRASLIASLALVTLAEAASSATPTLMWTDAKRVNILCNVAGGPGIDQAALSARLCRDLTRIAAQGAPMPVRTILIGDPAVLASDAVTLLVHASVTRSGQDRLLAFGVRPYRTSGEQTAVLFGAPPRAVRISPSLADSPALSEAMTVALSETLPWLARPANPQAIQ